MSVYIDCVKYKQLPLLKWRVPSVFFTSTWEAEGIGYAGGWDTELREVYRDIERNFVNVYINGHYDCFLYQSDMVIPEPSAESVNELAWGDDIAGSGEISSNTIVDKRVIKELFDILALGEKTRSTK